MGNQDFFGMDAGESSRRGRLAPVLSHHRTYRSVYGGSQSLTCRQNRTQTEQALGFEVLDSQGFA